MHARPGAARDEVAGTHGDAVAVRVRAAPEKGRANRSVEAVVADLFGVPTSAVTVTAGLTGRAKRVLVRGIDLGHATERLQAVLGPGPADP